MEHYAGIRRFIRLGRKGELIVRSGRGSARDASQGELDRAHYRSVSSAA